jgi:hypothetical protein
MRAELDYRQPIDFGEPISLVRFRDGEAGAVAFVGEGASLRAVARVGDLP